MYPAVPTPLIFPLPPDTELRQFPPAIQTSVDAEIFPIKVKLLYNLKVLFTARDKSIGRIVLSKMCVVLTPDVATCVAFIEPALTPPEVTSVPQYKVPFVYAFTSQEASIKVPDIKFPVKFPLPVNVKFVNPLYKTFA